MNLELHVDRNRPIHLQIAAHLRKQIEAGELDSYQALPPAIELGKLWGVHYQTVHKALNQLKKAGLLRRTTVGTQVAPVTKSFSLAVLFGPNLAQEMCHFDRALLKELRDLAVERGWLCHAYDGFYLHGYQGFKSTSAYNLFAADRTHHEFNAVIEIGINDTLRQLLKSSLPAYAARFSAISFDADVQLDYRHFALALGAYLASLGARRIAYVRTVGAEMGDVLADLDGWAEATRRFNLEVLPAIQVNAISVFNRQVESMAHRLTLQCLDEWRTAGRMPEAIVVSDDVAARAVALALIRRNIKVPEQLRVLTWSNQGINHHYGIPVIKYEVSPNEIARHLIGIAEKRLAGEKPRGLPIMIQGRIVDTKTTFDFEPEGSAVGRPELTLVTA